MSGAIRYTCRTPNCPNWISFHSDTFVPKDWLCPACEDALDQQMVESLYQEQLAQKLVALAEDKERENTKESSRIALGISVNTANRIARGDF